MSYTYIREKEKTNNAVKSAMRLCNLNKSVAFVDLLGMCEYCNRDRL